MKGRWVIVVLMASMAVTACAAPVRYVKSSSNRRYLIGMDNQPFLIAGDCAAVVDGRSRDERCGRVFADRSVARVQHGLDQPALHDLHGGDADGSTYDGILPFTNNLPNTGPAT